MSARPVEDLIIERQEAAEHWQRLLEHLAASGRIGSTPPEFVLCHLLEQGFSLDEIQADYGCSHWALRWRLRQALKP